MLLHGVKVPKRNYVNSVPTHPYEYMKCGEVQAVLRRLTIETALCNLLGRSDC